jgi:hypothetical protein
MGSAEKVKGSIQTIGVGREIIDTGGKISLECFARRF